MEDRQSESNNCVGNSIRHHSMATTATRSVSVRSSTAEQQSNNNNNNNNNNTAGSHHHTRSIFSRGGSEAPRSLEPPAGEEEEEYKIIDHRTNQSPSTRKNSKWLNKFLTPPQRLYRSDLGIEDGLESGVLEHYHVLELEEQLDVWRERAIGMERASLAREEELKLVWGRELARVQHSQERIVATLQSRIQFLEKDLKNSSSSTTQQQQQEQQQQRRPTPLLERSQNMSASSTTSVKQLPSVIAAANTKLGVDAAVVSLRSLVGKPMKEEAADVEETAQSEERRTASPSRTTTEDSHKYSHRIQEEAGDHTEGHSTNAHAEQLEAELRDAHRQVSDLRAALDEAQRELRKTAAANTTAPTESSGTPLHPEESTTSVAASPYGAASPPIAATAAFVPTATLGSSTTLSTAPLFAEAVGKETLHVADETPNPKPLAEPAAAQPAVAVERRDVSTMTTPKHSIPAAEPQQHLDVTDALRLEQSQQQQDALQRKVEEAECLAQKRQEEVDRLSVALEEAQYSAQMQTERVASLEDEILAHKEEYRQLLSSIDTRPQSSTAATSSPVVNQVYQMERPACRDQSTMTTTMTMTVGALAQPVSDIQSTHNNSTTATGDVVQLSGDDTPPVLVHNTRSDLIEKEALLKRAEDAERRMQQMQSQLDNANTLRRGQEVAEEQQLHDKQSTQPAPPVVNEPSSNSATTTTATTVNTREENNTTFVTTTHGSLSGFEEITMPVPIQAPLVSHDISDGTGEHEGLNSVRHYHSPLSTDGESEVQPTHSSRTNDITGNVEEDNTPHRSTEAVRQTPPAAATTTSYACDTHEVMDIGGEEKKEISSSGTAEQRQQQQRSTTVASEEAVSLPSPMRQIATELRQGEVSRSSAHTSQVQLVETRVYAEETTPSREERRHDDNAAAVTTPDRSVSDVMKEAPLHSGEDASSFLSLHSPNSSERSPTHALEKSCSSAVACELTEVHQSAPQSQGGVPSLGKSAYHDHHHAREVSSGLEHDNQQSQKQADGSSTTTARDGDAGDYTENARTVSIRCGDECPLVKEEVSSAEKKEGCPIHAEGDALPVIRTTLTSSSCSVQKVADPVMASVSHYSVPPLQGRPSTLEEAHEGFEHDDDDDSKSCSSISKRASRDDDSKTTGAGDGHHANMDQSTSPASSMAAGSADGEGEGNEPTRSASDPLCRIEAADSQSPLAEEEHQSPLCEEHHHHACKPEGGSVPVTRSGEAPVVATVQVVQATEVTRVGDMTPSQSLSLHDIASRAHGITRGVEVSINNNSAGSPLNDDYYGTDCIATTVPHVGEEASRPHSRAAPRTHRERADDAAPLTDLEKLASSDAEDLLPVNAAVLLANDESPVELPGVLPPQPQLQPQPKLPTIVHVGEDLMHSGVHSDVNQRTHISAVMQHRPESSAAQSTSTQKDSSAEATSRENARPLAAFSSSSASTSGNVVRVCKPVSVPDYHLEAASSSAEVLPRVAVQHKESVSAVHLAESAGTTNASMDDSDVITAVPPIEKQSDSVVAILQDAEDAGRVGGSTSNHTLHTNHPSRQEDAPNDAGSDERQEPHHYPSEPSSQAAVNSHHSLHDPKDDSISRSKCQPASQHTGSIPNPSSSFSREQHGSSAPSSTASSSRRTELHDLIAQVRAIPAAPLTRGSNGSGSHNHTHELDAAGSSFNVHSGSTRRGLQGPATRQAVSHVRWTDSPPPSPTRASPREHPVVNATQTAAALNYYATHHVVDLGEDHSAGQEEEEEEEARVLAGSRNGLHDDVPAARRAAAATRLSERSSSILLRQPSDQAVSLPSRLQHTVPDSLQAHLLIANAHSSGHRADDAWVPSSTLDQQRRQPQSSSSIDNVRLSFFPAKAHGMVSSSVSSKGDAGQISEPSGIILEGNGADGGKRSTAWEKMLAWESRFRDVLETPTAKSNKPVE